MHINKTVSRNLNISQIFETVWRAGGISRIDISKQMGLYRSTVTSIIDSVLKSKIIIEGERGSATEKGGRKPINLIINKNAGMIIGLEVQPDFYTVSVVDLSGNVIFSKNQKIKEVKARTKTGAEKYFEDLIDKIINDVFESIKEIRIPKLAICIGVPGIVDTKKGVIIKSVPFNLENYDFSKTLFKKYKIPLLIENDAKCCAWLKLMTEGKQTLSEKSRDDFICVLVKDHKNGDTGIGLSIVVNGEILNGHNYAAGEYRSLSWRKESKGQTGLSDAVIKTKDKKESSRKQWLTDLFSTLTVFVPLLEPKKIYVYGQKDQAFIEEVIHKNIRQFEEITKLFKTQVCILKEDIYEISKGAAFMFIQKLCKIPHSEEFYYHGEITWKRVFKTN